MFAIISVHTSLLPLVEMINVTGKQHQSFGAVEEILINAKKPKYLFLNLTT